MTLKEEIEGIVSRAGLLLVEVDREVIDEIVQVAQKKIPEDREVGEMRYGGCNPDEDRGFNQALAKVREVMK